jgi:hypothetical protein
LKLPGALAPAQLAEATETRRQRFKRKFTDVALPDLTPIRGHHLVWGRLSISLLEPEADI